MTCAACSARIERVLNKIPGVTASVSLIDHRAHVQGLTVDEAIAAIRRAGYDARPLALSASFTHESATQTPLIERVRSWVTVIALMPMLAEMAWMLSGQHGLIAAPVQLVLATLMQTIVAWPFYRAAWRALRVGSANMETLVSLGTLSAYGWSISVMASSAPMHGQTALYFEASIVVLAMVRIGRRLEQTARQRALDVLNGLVRLDADPVERFDSVSQSWSFVPPDTLEPGALIRIHANEPIRIDAQITEGQTEVDESSLTGESLPAPKSAGSMIFAGCLNLSGAVTARVQKSFHESRRAEIGQKILSALSTRAPIAALADRIAAVFVPAVLLIALGTLVSHIALGSGLEAAIAPAVAVLVVACPCALGLATPAAIAAGLARSAQQGWLFRSADALQRAAKVNHVALDKTGTLTSGRPQIIALSSQAGSVIEIEPDQRQTPWPMWLAACTAAERGIEHPLAGALLAYAAGRPMPECGAVENFPGMGLRAQCESDAPFTVWVGKPSWVFAQTGSMPPGPLDNIHPNATSIDVVIDQKWQGRIWVADSLRPDARPAVQELIAQGKAVTLLSGDRASAVERISELLGGLPWLGGQTPEGKSAQLQRWKDEDRRVAMVGDGINDAAAMAHAHLGVALASGASLALETADLTISSSQPLLAVAQSLALAESVMKRVKENLFFAFGFNSLAIPLAAAGFLSPVVAGSAMALSSAAVMLNASRLLTWKPSTNRTTHE